MKLRFFALLLVMGCNGKTVEPNGGLRAPDGGETSASPTNETAPFEMGPVDVGTRGDAPTLAAVGNRLLIAYDRLDTNAVEYATSDDGGRAFVINRLPGAVPAASATPDGTLWLAALGDCEAPCKSALLLARAPARAEVTTERVATANTIYFSDPQLFVDGTRPTVVAQRLAIDKSSPILGGAGLDAYVRDSGGAWTERDLIPFSKDGGLASLRSSSDGATHVVTADDDTLVAVGDDWQHHPLPKGAVRPGDVLAVAVQGHDIWKVCGAQELEGLDTGQAMGTSVYERLRLVHSRDDGQTWDSPRDVATTRSGHFLPELAVTTTGALVMAYYAGAPDDQHATFEWIESRDDGGAWSQPRVLDAGLRLQWRLGRQESLGARAALRVDGSTAYLAWTSNDTGQSHVRFARRVLR